MKKILTIGFISLIILGIILLIFSNHNKDIDWKNSLGIDKIEFATKDIQGKAIDSSIFKNHDLTMINIWGTFCKPCIEEMPDIEMLYWEMKEQKVNIIGIVSDIVDPKTADELTNEAWSIVKKLDVTYPNIIPDAKLTSGLLKKVQLFPTTIFVDSKGRIVGEVIEGACTKQEYQESIMSILEKTK